MATNIGSENLEKSINPLTEKSLTRRDFLKNSTLVAFASLLALTGCETRTPEAIAKEESERAIAQELLDQLRDYSQNIDQKELFKKYGLLDLEQIYKYLIEASVDDWKTWLKNAFLQTGDTETTAEYHTRKIMDKIQTTLDWFIENMKPVLGRQQMSDIIRSKRDDESEIIDNIIFIKELNDELSVHFLGDEVTAFRGVELWKNADGQSIQVLKFSDWSDHPNLAISAAPGMLPQNFGRMDQENIVKNRLSAAGYVPVIYGEQQPRVDLNENEVDREGYFLEAPGGGLTAALRALDAVYYDQEGKPQANMDPWGNILTDQATAERVFGKSGENTAVFNELVAYLGNLNSVNVRHGFLLTRDPHLDEKQFLGDSETVPLELIIAGTHGLINQEITENTKTQIANAITVLEKRFPGITEGVRFGVNTIIPNFLAETLYTGTKIHADGGTGDDIVIRPIIELSEIIKALAPDLIVPKVYLGIRTEHSLPIANKNIPEGISLLDKDSMALILPKLMSSQPQDLYIP